VAALSGKDCYWALVTFTPIRDIALDKAALVKSAEERGDVQSATALEGRGNPSTVKNSSAWAAAEKVFYGTTNRVRGDLHEKGFNVVNHFDFQYLPGKKWDLYWDPEGILSTIPAVATCLLGVFAGFWLRNPNATETKKFSMLLVAGIAGIVLGRLWGLEFPIVKKIWTSSFVLVAGGYSLMLLGTFHQIIDVWAWRAWCRRSRPRWSIRSRRCAPSSAVRFERRAYARFARACTNDRTAITM